MEIPVTVRQSRSFVPIRFITEYFGGEVNWIGETSTVLLTISNVSDLIKIADTHYLNKEYEEAINFYLQALEEDAGNIYSTKQIANIYNFDLKLPEEAAIYLEKSYLLDQTDDIINDPFLGY